MIAAVLTDTRDRCACGDVATGPAGPSRIEGDEGVYTVAAGEPLCPPCSSATWRAYLDARRERLDLIAYSWTHPGATRADLARARAAADAQLQTAFPWWRA